MMHKLWSAVLFQFGLCQCALTAANHIVVLQLQKKDPKKCYSINSIWFDDEKKIVILRFFRVSAVANAMANHNNHRQTDRQKNNEE